MQGPQAFVFERPMGYVRESKYKAWDRIQTTDMKFSLVPCPRTGKMGRWRRCLYALFLQ
jgi:hypothetical protein